MAVPFTVAYRTRTGVVRRIGRTVTVNSTWPSDSGACPPSRYTKALVVSSMLTKMSSTITLP